MMILNSIRTYKIHQSFSSILPLYDAFILDQFGVLHNGHHALDGAPNCVSTLYNHGKKLIILSNTSSSSEAAMSKLPQLGFDPKHMLNAVTSGEEAARFLASEYKYPIKVLLFTWTVPRLPSPYDDFLLKCGTHVIPTLDVNDADIIITHGSECLRGPGDDSTAEQVPFTFFNHGELNEIEPILQRAKDRDLPMVCANPDFVVVKPDGTKAYMPGKIAEMYEGLGGKCTYFGKPHPLHFEACIRELGISKDRVAHVGDSLHHDIAGANAAGIPSIFVVGGVHREDLSCKFGDIPERSALDALFEKEGYVPTHVVPLFRL